MEGDCRCFETTLYLGWPALALAVIPLVALVGNITVCVVIGPNKIFHSGGFNAFLLSIAVCDIIMSVVLMPLSIKSLHGPDHLVDYPWLCDFWLILYVSLATVVGAQLFALTLDHSLTIASPAWHKRLSQHRLGNRLKVGLTWLVALLVISQLLGLQLVYSRPGGDFAQNGNLTQNATNSNVTGGILGYCAPKSPGFIFGTSIVSYVVPAILCSICYGVVRCRLKRAVKAIFKRPHTGSKEKAVEETLLASSAKLNGHKSEDGGSFTQKLSASLRRTNSGSRRGGYKRESMQHRSSVLDRHPSLRYSIKQQSSTKRDTPESAKSSIRRSRKSSPNPQSSLRCEHPALRSKHSWNSAVSDLDQPRSVSPAFLDNTCHSIADLISTNSSADLKVRTGTDAPQSASYCNLFTEQGRRERNSTLSAGLSVQDESLANAGSSLHASSGYLQQEPSSIDLSVGVPQSGSLEVTCDVEVVESSTEQHSADSSKDPKCLRVSPTNVVCEEVRVPTGSHPDTDCDMKPASHNSGNGSSGINTNLLSTDYRYEPLAVSEEPQKHALDRKKSSLSPRRTKKTSVQDLHLMSTTLGALLLVHFLLYLPFFVVYFGNIWCQNCGGFAPREVQVTFVWLMFASSAAKPFVYVKFHLNFRTVLFNLFRKGN